jgi:hypothetical protein
LLMKLKAYELFQGNPGSYQGLNERE